MFSPSPHYTSGGNDNENPENDMIFFKDTEEFYESDNYYTSNQQTQNKNQKLHTNRKDNSRCFNKSNKTHNDNIIINNNTNDYYFNSNETDDSNDYDFENENLYYHEKSSTITNSNNESPYQVKKDKSFNNKESNSIDIFDSPIKMFNKYSGSTTCSIENEKIGYNQNNTNNNKNYYSEKYFSPLRYGKIHTNIKINEKGSGSSIGSQKLLSARKQLIVSAYFRSFKILTLITFFLFICSIISTLTILSCISNTCFCLPKFEIQSTGLIKDSDVFINILNVFNMKPIIKDSSFDLKQHVTLIENFLGVLSGMVLDSSFNNKLIKDKINEIFENDESIIFKFNNFGYCKQQSLDENNISCHPYFGYGLDIPSVLIKDLTFSLSKEEIEGDAEYVSNIFVKNYRSLFHFSKLNEYYNDNNNNNNKYNLFGILSSLFSIISSYLIIIEFTLDLALLLGSILISIVFKHKANRSLNAYKDYLFESNLKRQFNEQKYRFSKIEGFLIGLTIFSCISTILRIINLIYEIIYILQIDNVLQKIDLKIIEGIRIISSGCVFDIVNILIHLIISICLIICIKYKPWIVKVSI